MSGLDPTPQAMAAWMEAFTAALQALFGENLLFVGLQGSRARGEAAPESDIDVVVILEKAGPAELAAYRALLDRLPQGALVCGFVSGRGELAAWEPGDLFQFYWDTTAYYGCLEALIPPPGEREARQAALAGACALYHAASHNYLHGRDPQALGVLLKGAAFTARADWFARTGEYLPTGGALAGRLPAGVGALLAARRELAGQSGWDSRCDTLSLELLAWAGELIARYGPHSKR